MARSPRRPAPALRSARCLLLAPPGEARDALRRGLERARLSVRSVSAPAHALEALDGLEPPSAVLVSQAVGEQALGELVRCGTAARLPVLVLGVEGAGLSLDAAAEGAADFVAAPAEAGVVVRRLEQLLRRTAPPADARSRGGLAGALGLVGRSAAIEALVERIERIARYKTNVLVLGESGVGKELVARALHACGQNREHLFVPLNCAALGKDIIENELFGHERGAFTGADELKRGLFELADGGTLFLDEIAEMEPSTQAKLLRVLEGNEFRRVGGSGKIKVDVNVVAATNQDLEGAVEAGRFREDLYYRLRVVTVAVPPLRERKEDVELLAEHFLREFNRRHGARLEGLTPEAAARLRAHDWPGNVRELKHAVEAAAILAAGRTISAPDVEASFAPRRRAVAPAAAGGLTVSVGERLDVVERRMIEATVARCASKAEAAEVLGIGLRTLYTRLRAYGVDA